MNKKKKFTVIIKAAENARLLKRTMDSLVKQSIGFAENIQVILYTGASQKKVCEGVKSEYPQNVIVQEKLDLTVADGTYVNYLQEGQNWHKDAFAQALMLFMSKAEDVTVVEEQYEEPQEGVVLENHVTNMLNHVEKVQQEPGKYLFHSRYKEHIKGIIEAKEKLDSDYELMQILLEAENIGILKLVKLYGRFVQYPGKTKDWYLKSLPQYAKLLEEQKQKNPKYIMNYDFWLMYQIAESLKDDIAGVLEGQALDEYKAWLKETLSHLDDYVIAKGKMNGATRRYAFTVKYGKESADEMGFYGGKLLFHNLIIYNLGHSICFRITDSKHTQKGNVVTGISMHPLPLKYVGFYLTDGCGAKYPFVETGKEGTGKKCLDTMVIREMEYECVLPEGVKREDLILMYRYRDFYDGAVAVENP